MTSVDKSTQILILHLGDKKVNVSEFGMAMGKVGMDKQAANYIFFRADENEDQFLDEAESKMVFASFDKNSKFCFDDLNVTARF